MTSIAERRVTLPTRPLMVVIWVTAVLVAIAWAALFAIVRRDGWPVWLGGGAAGVVAVSATLALAIIRPWHPRALGTWPMLWVLASFLKWPPTLAGAFLLYSATPLSKGALGVSVLVAYLAVLAGETRVYAETMKRLVPSGNESTG
jgi:hypothetical protein